MLKAMGRAITKIVTVAEMIKRRIHGLHHNTQISFVDINYMWEGLESKLYYRWKQREIRYLKDNSTHQIQAIN